MHLGSLPEGDPGDITNAEPQRQSAAQLGLCHGEETCGEGRPVDWTSCWVRMVVCFVCGTGQLD